MHLRSERRAFDERAAAVVGADLRDRAGARDAGRDDRRRHRGHVLRSAGGRLRRRLAHDAHGRERERHRHHRRERQESPHDSSCGFVMDSRGTS